MRALGQMMRQATTAEVRLDASKATRFNVSALSTGGFDRLLPHTERRFKTPEADPCATTRDPGNIG